MPATPNGLPYPDLNATPDVPYWLQQLADAVEARINKAIRGTTFNSPSAGSASGYRTITHGWPFTPSGVVVTPQSGLQFLTDTYTSTTFRLRILNSDGSVNDTTQTISAVGYA